MAWQQWFVLSWMQFAMSSLIILLVASLVLRWISQPIEKVRLIQWMLATLVAMPFLFAFPIMSFRIFDLSSWLASSQDTANSKPRIESSTLHIAKPVGRVDDRKLLSDRIESGTGEIHEKTIVAIAAPLEQPAGVLDCDATRSPIRSSFISLDLPVLAFDFGWLAAVALVTAHILAVVYFLIQRRLGMTRLRQTLLKSTAASESLRSRWNKITNGRGQNVRLYLSTKVETPLTYGWRNPIVVLPAEIAAGSETDLDACLAHEWSHIEGGDALVWFWMNLAQYALWYQPLYWTLRKELRICLELIADHRTVSSVCDPFAYSDLLLRLATRQRRLLPENALTMSGQSSQLTRRIRALLDTELRLRFRCRSSFSVMAIMGFLLLSIFTSMFRFTTSDASEPTRRIGADDDNSSKSKRFVTFARMVEEKAIGKSQRFKEYVTEDGRRRWERGEANMDTTAIFDRSGSKSITLHHNTKIAISPALEVGSTNHTWQNLQQLKNGREYAKELLGAKEMNGLQVGGFRIEQFERTYTVWKNVADGELVRVEYVSPEKEQITLSEFAFANSIDDALFDCTVPTGYEVQKNRPRRTSWLYVWGQSQQQPVGMSLEWSRSRMDSRHIATNSDGTRLYVLGANQMDIIDPANHRLLTFPVNANMVTTADLDGDGTREFVAFKFILNNGRPWKFDENTYQWTVSAYSEAGIPKWTYSSEVAPFYESKVRGITAADLNGDGRDEIILETVAVGSLDAQILDSEGKLKPVPEGIRGLRAWDVGDIEGDTSPDIVSIKRNGDLCLGDRNGNQTQEIETGLQNWSVHIWKKKSKPLPGDGNILVFGSLPTINPFALFNSQRRLASFDTKGKQQWSVDLQARLSYVLDCPNRDWIAVRSVEGAYCGNIQVIDASSGEVIASKRYVNVHVFQGVAWMKAANGEPLLVLSSDDKIEAFRIASK